MANKNIIITAVLVFVGLLLLNGASYIINEKEQVIITQFGKPVGEPITEPGLHFKLPFIQKVNFFEKRFLEWNGSPDEVPTKDKTYIFVDTYARWEISDPLLFFQKVQNETRAQSRLDDILDGAARVSIAKHELFELVRTTNRELVREQGTGFDSEISKRVEKGRAKIVAEIIAASQEKAIELGIKILDFRFKRIKYADSVQRKIYDRMISERQKIADKFRSEGQGAYEKILGDKERELLVITSQAKKESEVIRGKADAAATAIYANAYNRTADTRDFYKFLKTMETYQKTLSEKDVLFLSTKSDFFQYLKSQK